MTQEYELVDLRISDFKDDYGNSWVDAAFQGVSEPVKWVVKDPDTLKVGQKYYGRIDVKTSKAGKTYNRFYKEQKEDTPGTPENASKEESIHRSVALQQAVAYTIGHKLPEKGVTELADTFYDWLVGKVEPEEAKLSSEDLGENGVNLDDIPY